MRAVTQLSVYRAKRVLIADSDPVFRLGVCTLLSEQSGIEVTSEASDPEQTIALVERDRPDLLYLDWEIATANEGWVLRRLQAIGARCRTVVAGHRFSQADLGIAMHLGVRGLLTKRAIVDTLATCLERVAGGEYFIAPGETIPSERGRHGTTPQGAGLSPRELEIMNRVVEGASNKQIAGELGITEQTVKNLLRKVFQKMGVDNRVSLTLRSLGMGITPRSHRVVSGEGQGAMHLTL